MPSDGHPTSPSQYHHPQDARLDMEQNTRPLSPRGYGGEQSPPYHQREPPMEGNSEFQNRPPPSAEALEQARKETKTLWLGGIPFHYNDADLKRVFDRFGEVADVKVGYSGGQPLGYCFITFQTRESTEKAFEAVKAGFIGDQPPQEGLSWRVDYDIGKEKKKELGIPPSKGGMKGRYRGRGFHNNVVGRRFDGPPPMRRGGYRGGGVYHGGPPHGGYERRSPPYNPLPYGMVPPLDNGPPPANYHPPHHEPPHHYPPPSHHYPYNGRERPYYGSGVSHRYEPYGRGPPPHHYRGGYRGGRNFSPPHQQENRLDHSSSPPINYSGGDRGGDGGNMEPRRRPDVGQQHPPPNNW
ncbi:hypothetical protein FDP41_010097 [Naegleria fowleri]|uniref:RRM domain-containing protein n=1 Tax=Naegleria fowleri TaxID=5763 RepID=A0A6A5BCN7_NAEFO|nr:uncharacterized protein FDP41_010097 [Naegleria fowleri]KAF0971874.1 hypothetical protein FDP41_010097 [Naegleria fowleri]